MSKILKYILFLTFLIVIALHAIIPHPHSDELTEEKHFELHHKSNSLIGLIRLVFHESNDEDMDNLMFVQFERLKKLGCKCKYQKVYSLNLALSKIEEREAEQIVSSSTNNFIRFFFVKLNGLRGPPLLT
ncbi:MAG: hypothetical protein HN704_11465 [Bacteroidetes bacterium]|nr:hypothetical protein [Bacteroidota bacterium]MBT7169503.1 hypothetical protein [Candidatus Woesearchaeota archaeon]MBT7492210.1 hypothetical protein [Bacteroidota bacterium]